MNSASTIRKTSNASVDPLDSEVERVSTSYEEYCSFFDEFVMSPPVSPLNYEEAELFYDAAEYQDESEEEGYEYYYECNSEIVKEAIAASQDHHHAHESSKEEEASPSCEETGLNLDEFDFVNEEPVCPDNDGSPVCSSRTACGLVEAFHQDGSVPYDVDSCKSNPQKRKLGQEEAELPNGRKGVSPSDRESHTRLKQVRAGKTRDSAGPNLSADSKATKRRQPDTPFDDHQATDKVQKVDDLLFAAGASPLVLDVTPKFIEHDRDLERRTREAMMRTSDALSEEQWEDPMLVAEYAGEIFAHLYDVETEMMGDPDYASSPEQEISWDTRGLFIDWMIEVHMLLDLLPETLFLTVNIIDRFLSLRNVPLGKLQLVGIASLFIATKFEEILCPNILDFLRMADNAFTEDEFMKAERFILQTLDFRLCHANPLAFLSRICVEEMECDIHTRTLSKFFMEAALIDHRFIGIRPSQIAASSLWLSRKMLGKGKWTRKFTTQTGYDFSQVKPVVTMLLDFFTQPVTHDTFFSKWSSEKYSKASIFVREWVSRYYLNK